MWCIGFSDCSNKGYSDSQYSKYWGNMYWLMYSGRNCVNYVAFREVQAGMPNVRPWNGSGNAEAWGRDNPSITDQTPRVGAVAWWRGGAQGAGSLGHVAYVERVISPTEIVVSESNWGSDFDWRYINTSQNWPSGFIHWTDRPLVPSVKPSVPGAPAVNDVIESNAGTWPAGTSLSYQWGIAWKPIAGATGWRYRPQANQLGQKLTLTITATRPGYLTTTTTVGPRTAIAPGTLDGLTSPAISGTVQVGQPLTVSTPQVAPNASSMAVQWFANGVAIPGATTSTFTPTQDQNGSVLTASVTASRQAFTPLTTFSAGTIPVVSPPIVLSAAGGISGQHLTRAPMAASPGTYAPADATVGYQWLRNGAPIPGATKQTYVPGPADLAQKLGVTVSLTKAKYLNAVRTYNDTATIRSTSSVVSTARGGENTVQFTVHVNAYGTVPTGTVVVTIAGSHYVGTLVNGFAGVTAKNVPAGDLNYGVSYLGDAKSVVSNGGGAVRVLPSSTTHTVIDRIGTVSGPLVAGGTLTAPQVLYAPWDSQITYQWRRDGAPIAGATGSTYRLTHADSGHMVTVVETARHQGLQPNSSVFAPVGPVIADPTFAVTTLGGVTQAKATITVKEMGKPATGTVTFASGAVKVTRTLVNGVASASLNGLAPGTRTISISYSGDSLTSAGMTSAQVPVLAKPAASTAAIDPNVTVTGTPTIGAVLSLQVHAYAPWSGRLYYQWLRDGKPIAGAVNSAYQVQDVDAGHKLSVRATVKAAQTTPATAVYQVARVITTTAVMGLISTPGPNTVTVKVQVSAANLPATGTVQLVLRGTTRQVTATLRNGVATLTMTQVPAGRDAFYVIYSGSAAAPSMHRTIVLDVAHRS
ncbi:hypothetical protein Back2_08360 [Nocardioides baekrokdamisoli]|uniref:Peptidase C51 domain-containing protein n=1 Tax=Nocardioides baekrokdamisoli TaxID=1804624 RepID=A0A3G9J0R2_9ACTN|nr:hypothetical protein Back2_08360 [Nocardioides baekrokdamisoli]